jgi:hypothetical protein
MPLEDPPPIRTVADADVDVRPAELVDPFGEASSSEAITCACPPAPWM